MLRKIRIALAVLFFAAVTALFLDFTGTIHAWLGWTAKIQFLPAILALNVGVVIALVVITLLVGRVYCSVVCPLGVMQDIIAWLSGRRKNKKYRHSYSPARKWLRYSVLAVFIIALVAHLGSLAALIAPYSAYGRIAANIMAPVWQWGNNVLAYFAERADSYAFYTTDVWLKSMSSLIIAVATLLIIGSLAWRNGRTWCNTICPVGTVLGWLSQYSLFRVTIDSNKCNHCGLCSRRCKAACINGKEHSIDYSRCVACMDCIDTCKHGAISLSLRKGKSEPHTYAPDTSRRAFLTGAVVATGALAANARRKKVDGGLAVIEDKKIPARLTGIVPAGAESHRHFYSHCTACQLCIAVCPNGVLRPATSLDRLMKPEMSYERGYCRPECTRCSEVCPAGAIVKIDRADKSSTQIGHAVWVKENCVVLTDNVSCGNCARHCPSGAIQMVPSDPDNPSSRKIPVVNTERCIGCGACENLCPARPFSAIYVEGHENHRTI